MRAADPRPFWRRRLLAPFLALLGLNAAAFAVFTLPRTVQERSLASRAETLRAEVERERRLGTALRRRVETIHSNERDVKEFYSKVVSSKDATLLPVLREIDRFARELGLETGNTTYKPEEVKGVPLLRFVVTMPVAGTYRQIVGLLDRIERSSHFVTVDQVEIREPAGGETDLRLVLSAYFRAESEGDRGL